ncbi:MAG TPA: ester cyclase [Candidatus Dormibacteraeota bacterium]|nr:ester cyclase [Candidatus Dormibacteraeota bacterium]
MSIEETRRVIEGYFTGHGGNWFSEEVEFHDMSQPQARRGRAEVEAWLHTFYQDAFADARAEAARLVIGDGIAAADWVFQGRHVGSLAGESPSGRVVELPMAALYEVRDGEIVRARLYYDSATLLRQLQPNAMARPV